MPYTNPAIQLTGNRFQEPGMIGTVYITDNNTWYVDVNNVADGITVAPGYGVYYDSTSDGWILPVDTVSQLLVTHIIKRSPTNLATAVTNQTNNSNSEIVFVGGEDSGIGVSAYAAGSIWVEANGAITKGANVIFDIGGATVSESTTEAGYKLLGVALDTGVDGHLIPVRFQRVA